MVRCPKITNKYRYKDFITSQSLMLRDFKQFLFILIKNFINSLTHLYTGLSKENVLPLGNEQILVGVFLVGVCVLVGRLG